MNQKTPPDDVLAETYKHFGVSADRIATSQELKCEFRSKLPVEYRSVDLDLISLRLISLRKQGKLPRIKR